MPCVMDSYQEHKMFVLIINVLFFEYKSVMCWNIVLNTYVPMCHAIFLD